MRDSDQGLAPVRSCASSRRTIIASIFLFGVSSMAASGQTIQNYSYDKMGRLQSVAVASGAETTFEYDDAGNRTHKVVTGTQPQGARQMGGVIVSPDVTGYRVIPIAPECGPVNGCGK